MSVKDVSVNIYFDNSLIIVSFDRYPYTFNLFPFR
jgi:hypothetical protein